MLTQEQHKLCDKAIRELATQIEEKKKGGIRQFLKDLFRDALDPAKAESVWKTLEGLAEDANVRAQHEANERVKRN